MAEVATIHLPVRLVAAAPTATEYETEADNVRTNLEGRFKMSIRKVVWGLGMCVWIPLSANVHAIALFQFESVESAASEFQYYIPPIPTVEDGMGGTRENSNNLPWNRSLNVILPLATGYLDMLPVSEGFASPSIGLYLPLLLGENEDFDANISRFIQDEEEFANLLVIPDLFMETEWQPTESSLQSAPFTPHSYSGNVARARNIASACMQPRDVAGSKSGVRDSDCIEAGSGESGSVANRSGSMAGSGFRSPSARSARGGGTVDGASSGGGGGGAGGGGAGDRHYAPGIGERGNDGGMSSSGSNNSDPDNSSEGNPSGAEGGRSNQGNGNNGTGESSVGGGGTGGNEDWGYGNGDTGNWNNPWEGEGSPPSELALIPEPATLALLALGLAALCAVRGKSGKDC